MIGKGKLVFDPAATLDEQDNAGAFLRAADGLLVTQTTFGSTNRLDVNLLAEHTLGVAAAGGDKGIPAYAVDNLGNYAMLKVNAAGELLVDIQMISGSDKREDDAAASLDVGSYVLSVRQDVLGSTTSLSGDFQSFKTDSLGALWIRPSAVSPAPNTAFTAAAISVGATVGGTALWASPLTDRVKVQIQNNGNKPIFVGPSGVTVASGQRVDPGAAWEVEAGPAIALYAIASAAVDVRVFEIA
jgi:hypothetical protein